MKHERRIVAARLLELAGCQDVFQVADCLNGVSSYSLNSSRQKATAELRSSTSTSWGVAPPGGTRDRGTV